MNTLVASSRKPADKSLRPMATRARSASTHGFGLAGSCIATVLLATPAYAQTYTSNVALQCNESVYFAPGLGHLNVISRPASTNPGIAQGSGSVGNPRSKGRRRPGGTDGGITITAGSRNGATTISYIIENFEGETATVSIGVNVSCPPPPPPTRTVTGFPPVNAPPPKIDAPHLTITHRTTSCGACRGIAEELNQWIDFYSGGQEDYPGIMFIIRNLANDLDDCEKKCPPPPVPATVSNGSAVVDTLKSRRETIMPGAPPVTVIPPVTLVPPELGTVDGPVLEKIANPDPKTIERTDPKAIANPEPKTIERSDPKTIVNPEPKSIERRDPKTIANPRPKTVVRSEPKPIVRVEPKTVVQTGSKAKVRTEPKIAMRQQPKMSRVPVAPSQSQSNRFSPVNAVRSMGSTRAAPSTGMLGRLGR